MCKALRKLNPLSQKHQRVVKVLCMVVLAFFILFLFLPLAFPSTLGFIQIFFGLSRRIVLFALAFAPVLAGLCYKIVDKYEKQKRNTLSTIKALVFGLFLIVWMLPAAIVAYSSDYAIELYQEKSSSPAENAVTDSLKANSSDSIESIIFSIDFSDPLLSRYSIEELEQNHEQLVNTYIQSFTETRAYSPRRLDYAKYEENVLSACAYEKTYKFWYKNDLFLAPDSNQRIDFLMASMDARENGDYVYETADNQYIIGLRHADLSHEFYRASHHVNKVIDHYLKAVEWTMKSIRTELYEPYVTHDYTIVEKLDKILSWYKEIIKFSAIDSPECNRATILVEVLTAVREYFT